MCIVHSILRDATTPYTERRQLKIKPQKLKPSPPTSYQHNLQGTIFNS